MSQQEFDNYLALLTRLLRIAPQQREQVAEEFRTHLEDRLEDLLARGISRDQAVQLALEEFGDAAGLAAELAQISAIRKRRWYMKVSAFSVAGLAAAVLLAIALWPESERLPATPQAIAQQPATKGTKGKAKAAPQQTLEEKLASRMNVDFLETPLSEVMDYFHANNNIQVYINRRALGDESIMLDAPITMSLSDVKAETVLDLALEQVSGQLAYLERDGVLIISTVTALEGATEVRVYNCRDLLALTMPSTGMMGGMGMEAMPFGGGASAPGIPGAAPIAPGEDPMGFSGARDSERRLDFLPPGEDPAAFPVPRNEEPLPAIPAPPAPAESAPVPGVPMETPSPLGEGPLTPPSPRRTSVDRWQDRAALAQIGGMGGMMPGMMPGMGGSGMGRSRPEPQTDHDRKAARLMDLIITAVEPNSWQDTGGFGTISEYEGLIVVNHNPRTHKKIESVLSMLRQSAGLPENGVMPMGMPGMMGSMGPAAGGGGGLPPGANFVPPRSSP